MSLSIGYMAMLCVFYNACLCGLLFLVTAHNVSIMFNIDINDIMCV